jgi:ribA/ribD-fused uncharacterized protein
MKFDIDNNYHYTDDYVFFTRSFLSQWYGAFPNQESTFKLKIFDSVEICFNCAEQAMMWSKAMMFSDYDIAQQILNERHPEAQKSLGREVRNFNQSIWDNLKFDLIVSINTHKFSQNSHLQSKLLDTENKILVEAAPWDKVWGIGMGIDDPNILDRTKWRGENLLGKSLMWVRKNLRGSYEFYNE